MKSVNFTAFDFETATNKHMPCQLGLVVVRGSEIVEEKEWLIRPPENRYDHFCMKAHGITPKDTENCKEFSELWNEIKPYFEHEVLVAHNVSFDRGVLLRAVDFYKLEDFREICYLCTCDMFKKGKLADVANTLDIKLNNHHNALCDARACAEIYLAYLNGAGRNFFRQYRPKDNSPLYPERTVSLEAKTQDLSIVENKNTIFYDKKVVISGEFEKFPIREELALLLKGFGADINGSVSRKTDIFIIGKKFGLKKMEQIEELKADGYQILILTEGHLLAILPD